MRLYGVCERTVKTVKSSMLTWQYLANCGISTVGVSTHLIDIALVGNGKRGAGSVLFVLGVQVGR